MFFCFYIFVKIAITPQRREITLKKNHLPLGPSSGLQKYSAPGSETTNQSQTQKLTYHGVCGRKPERFDPNNRVKKTNIPDTDQMCVNF